MKKGENPPGRAAGRVCSVTGTALILLVIVLCSLLVLPGALGYRMYHVLSGSMEPTIPVGSLLYVEGGPPEEVEEEDVIAFYSSVEGGGIITHRVTENNVVMGRFHTKGDANEQEDPLPASYEAYIGRVVYVLPLAGALLTVMTSFYGKLAAMGVVLLGVILSLIGTRDVRSGAD